VAEGARLESVYTGNRIVGSNPTPSATPQKYSTTRAFSLRYPLIPELRGVRLLGAGLRAGVSYTATQSSLFY
jgi:hypothetical protein